MYSRSLLKNLKVFETASRPQSQEVRKRVRNLRFTKFRIRNERFALLEFSEWFEKFLLIMMKKHTSLLGMDPSMLNQNMNPTGQGLQQDAAVREPGRRPQRDGDDHGPGGGRAPAPVDEGYKRSAAVASCSRETGWSARRRCPDGPHDDRDDVLLLFFLT